MAIRLTSSSSQYLSITASVLNSVNPYTICWWYRTPSFTSVNGVMLIGAGNGYQFNDMAYFKSSGVTLSIWAAHNGVGSEVDASQTIAADTWAHMALVRSSVTDLKLYKDGNLIATDTYDITGRGTTDTLQLGLINSAQYGDGRFYGAKAWTTALTPTEIAAEMTQARAVKTANLYAEWPLQNATDLSDYSGNGHDWSAPNSASTEASPDIPLVASSFNNLILTGDGTSVYKMGNNLILR